MVLFHALCKISLSYPKVQLSQSHLRVSTNACTERQYWQVVFFFHITPNMFENDGSFKSTILSDVFYGGHVAISLLNPLNDVLYLYDWPRYLTPMYSLTVVSRGKGWTAIMKVTLTLPETNSSHLKIGHPKRKLVFQPSIFRCELLVSGRVESPFWREHKEAMHMISSTFLFLRSFEKTALERWMVQAWSLLLRTLAFRPKWIIALLKMVLKICDTKG